MIQTLIDREPSVIQPLGLAINDCFRGEFNVGCTSFLDILEFTCADHSEQGPAFGVALLAMVGAGEYKNIEEACAATIELASETPVDRKTLRSYDKGFPVYQGLYQSLKSDFKRISSLG